MNKNWNDKTEEIGYIAHKKLGEQGHRKSIGKTKGVNINYSDFNTVIKEFSFMMRYGKCYLCSKNMPCLKHPKWYTQYNYFFRGVRWFTLNR